MSSKIWNLTCGLAFLAVGAPVQATCLSVSEVFAADSSRTVLGGNWFRAASPQDQLMSLWGDSGVPPSLFVSNSDPQLDSVPLRFTSTAPSQPIPEQTFVLGGPAAAILSFLVADVAVYPRISFLLALLAPLGTRTNASPVDLTTVSFGLRR